MHRKYLVGPFILLLAAWTYANGTLPLLPLYAVELGASQAVSGLFLAFSYLCVAVGNMAPALLPKSFHHRRLILIATGFPYVVLTWLSGHVSSVLQLAVVTGILWFVGGVILSQTATLVGLAAPEQERGMAFGVLAMTGGLGMLIGGLSVGHIADRFGYRGVFDVLAAFCVLIIVGSLLCIEPRVSPVSEGSRGAATGGGHSGGLLIIVFVAQLLVMVANGPGNLGRSFSMSAQGFSKSAITLTAAIGGLVSLGLPLALGWLSDRFGRRWILIGSCVAAAASLLLLGFARSLWQFLVFAVLFAFLNIPRAIGPSVVVDLDPAGDVGRHVSIYGAMAWVGSIAGMALGGYAIQGLGTTIPILLSVSFPVVAAMLFAFMRKKSAPRRSSTPALTAA